MDILTEDMKKELKEKFKALDINDEHFQEKAQEIIDEAIVGNKEKIGKKVVQKTVDEELEYTKECFEDLKQLVDEGVLEDFEDESLRDDWGEKADHGIIDEVGEKLSLEAAGVLKEPNKETTIEDLVEEILKQLEEAIEEKKQEVEKKIEKNEDMLGKVAKREKLRATKVKVGNLHNKTKTLKGTEGKQLNGSVEAAIVDLDRQINTLVAATTIDGNELQSEALKEERQKLTEEKQKLEDMSKFLKEKYTKDHAKEGSKAILKSEIKQIMGEMEYGMGPNRLIKASERLKDLYKDNKSIFEEEELKAIFKEFPLAFDVDLEKNLNAYNLALTAGQVNDVRREYIEITNKGENELTPEDEAELENDKKIFASAKEIVEAISNSELLPLKTEDEYTMELEGLKENAKDETGFFNKGKKAKEVVSKMNKLRLVLNEIMSVTKTGKIRPAYDKVREILNQNPTIDDLPKKLEEEKRVNLPPKFPTPMPHENTGNEQGEGEKAETKTQAGTTQSDDDGYGEL